jgi:hypothetical protein
MSEALVKTEPLEVPVALEEPMVADREAVAALRRAGLVTMAECTLRDLKTIGVHIHGAGTLRIQRGRAMVTQQMLADTMRELFSEIQVVKSEKETKARHKLMLAMAHALGALSAKMTESQELMLKLEGGTGAVADSGPPPGLVKSFTPGQQVQAGGTLAVAREIHFHATEPAKPQ